MRASNPTFDGTITVNGVVECGATVGRKVDFYNDANGTYYGAGINDFELCLFAGEGAALRWRPATAFATGTDAPSVFEVSPAGNVALPAGATLAIGAHNLSLSAAGALLIDGAPLSSGGGATGTMGTQNADAVAITGGTIDGATVGTTTPNTGRFTVLTATTQFIVGSNALAQTAAIYFNAAAGQVKQFVYQSNGAIRWTIGSNNVAESGSNAGSDFAFARWDDAGNWIANALTITRSTGAVGIPVLAATGGTAAGVAITGGSINNAPIGATTATTGRFTTLTATGFVQRSSATGLTASTTNTQAGALGLTASINNITTAAANSAVRLPATAPATGMATEIFVRNGGANAVNVFPATGASINALAANAAFSLAAGASARFQQLTATLYITV